MGGRVAIGAERVGFGEGSSPLAVWLIQLKNFDMPVGGSNLPNHLETPLRDDSVLLARRIQSSENF